MNGGMIMQVTALGAIVGLVLSIVLIIRKVHPAYGLILGAIVGGLIGGAGLAGTVTLMIGGAKGIMPAILRILTAGVLAGVLIESGAAAKIAESIVDKLGESNSLIALALATLDRKSTRLNSSHANISYAVFCLKKKQHTLSIDTY